MELILGTNKFASQKGMSMGAVRHVADIRADDMVQEGQDHVQLQAGTNKCASQKGMSMGSVRHVSDIRADDCVREGMDHVQLQSGWLPSGLTEFGKSLLITNLTEVGWWLL